MPYAEGRTYLDADSHLMELPGWLEAAGCEVREMRSIVHVARPGEFVAEWPRAFVDVGVHQDGLVHVSELANRYVKDASEVVKVGQIVRVQVLSTDPKAKRIALSMKALDAPPPRPQPAVKKPSLDRQVAALQNKFRTK